MPAERSTTDDTSRTGPFTGTGDDPRAAPSAPPDFEILGELGRGGMGVVYKARQVSLNRPCALKMILSGGHATDHERRRFLAEGEAVAALHHPNIVAVYQSGTHEGLPWFALEYCGGGSLSRRLRDAPPTPAEAARMVEVLARAVQAAHAAGIIHRDLKPANVLLADDGSPRVADFGLARRTDSEGPTATGAVMGTPAYMAPEQAGGGTREAGPAADVWALGAILYECLAGKPPFKGTTTAETLLRVLHDDVSPPPGPRDLVTICLKCLQKEPGRRYASADALAEDLRRWLAGEPITARPVGHAERFLLWVRRRPRVALLAFVAVGSLIAGTAVSVAFGISASRRLQQANDALARLEETAADGLIRPIGHSDHSSALARPEMEALNELADLPPERRRVRRLFVLRAFRRPTTLAQLSRRLPAAVHAAVGLDRSLAEEMSQEAGAGMAGADPRARAVWARVAALLEVGDDAQAEAAATHVVGLLSGDSDQSGRHAAGHLEALARRLPSASLAALWGGRLAALKNASERASEDATLLALPGLAEAMPAGRRPAAAREALAVLEERMRSSDGHAMQAFGRRGWMACARLLAAHVPAAEAARIALALADSLDDHERPDGWVYGMESLAALAAALPAAEQARVKAAALAKLRRWCKATLEPRPPGAPVTRPGEADRAIVAAALALKAVATVRGDAAPVEELAEAITAAARWDVPPGDDPGLAYDAIAAAAGLVSDKEAGERLGWVFARMMGGNAQGNMKTLADAHVRYAARAPASACVTAADRAAGTLGGKLPPGRLPWIGGLLRDLLPRLPAREAEGAARLAADGLIRQLGPRPDPVVAADCQAGLEAALPRLPPSEAAALARRLGDALLADPNPDLAGALGPVAAPHLPPEAAGRLARALLARLLKGSGDEAVFLVEGIGPLVSRCGPEARAEVVRGLAEAVRRWPAKGVTKHACAVLGRSGDAGACRIAFDALRTAFPDRQAPGRFAVARDLAALAPVLDAAARRACLETLAEATAQLDRHSQPAPREALALAVRVAGGEPLLPFALAHLDASHEFGPEAAALLATLDVAGLRRVLRHPVCLDGTRRTVLDEVGRRAGKPMPTLWDAAAWLDGAALEPPPAPRGA